MQSGIKQGAIKLFGTAIVFFVFFGALVGMSLSALADDLVTDDSAIPYRVYEGKCDEYDVSDAPERHCGQNSFLTIEPYAAKGGLAQSQYVLSLSAEGTVIALGGARRMDGRVERFSLHSSGRDNKDIEPVTGQCELQPSGKTYSLQCEVKPAKGKSWHFSLRSLTLFMRERPVLNP